jgi:hypothetical protein
MALSLLHMFLFFLDELVDSSLEESEFDSEDMLIALPISPTS